MIQKFASSFNNGEHKILQLSFNFDSMQFVIFLRGINVGGRSIKMNELKNCLEVAGFSNVSTILQTGNVILETNEKNITKLKTIIESTLSSTFNYPAKVWITAPAELFEIINNNPFKDSDNSFHQYILFTIKDFSIKLVTECGKLNRDLETVFPGNNVVYWKVKKGNTLESDFGKFISKASNKAFLTNRNINTLHKVIAKTNFIAKTS